MNANELTDKLVKWHGYGWIKTVGADDLIDEAIAMLRQLQAEKEALKVRSWEGDSLISKLSEEIEELKILFDKTMNNWAKDMERKK